ncbi:hypothetical protein HX017_17625 [Myroides marinus]|uniref:Uncharacterized protein n=1 Tax=Myroides marinus TaxID=703342 RepID=A0A1H6WD39_9FLAO|nr:hypothetical protein [Myroides marinus]MDM1352416.1 hypothetical protein [Myroides marinus]MDM1353212.1 hypothetical protein [Myroides marinus]MDM1359621.1 hypothetical protein [Myroides marinus]MDM1366750.1 hypothetical protein [Myroides marinus]MDM1533949.1 hypothetical protein [Myroides marinus]
MARKNKTENKLKNRIKEVIKEEGVSAILVGLWVDVNKATVSAWNSNSSQPTDKNLNMIGELFEIDNRMLLDPQVRIKTGLAQALQKELDRLTKIEKIPIYTEKIDIKTGKKVKANNDELVLALKKFAEEFKK